MAIQLLTISAAWPVVPHFAATAPTDVMIVNPNERDTARLTWVVTEDDTAPVLDSGLGAPIKPGGTQAMSLMTGECIWLAAPAAGLATFSATLMTGAS